MDIQISQGKYLLPIIIVGVIIAHKVSFAGIRLLVVAVFYGISEIEIGFGGVRIRKSGSAVD